MKVKLNRKDEYENVDTVYLELQTLNPKQHTEIRIKQLFTGNLEITKVGGIQGNTIMVIPYYTNQIQIKGD